MVSSSFTALCIKVIGTLRFPILAYMSVHVVTQCPNERYEIRPYGPVPNIGYSYVILQTLH